MPLLYDILYVIFYMIIFMMLLIGIPIENDLTIEISETNTYVAKRQVILVHFWGR